MSTRSEIEVREYTAREFLWWAGSRLDLDGERLQKWHEQGLLPGGPVGRGKARLYSATDLLYIVAFATLVRQLPHVAYAQKIAEGIAPELVDVYLRGDGDYWDQAPMLIVVRDEQVSPPYRIIKPPSGDLRTFKRWHRWISTVDLWTGDIAYFVDEIIGNIRQRREAENAAR